MYSRLNVKFDEYSGESRVSIASEAISEVETILKEKGVYDLRSKVRPAPSLAVLRL
jgi:arginyl-tRNA synthetase